MLKLKKEMKRILVITGVLIILGVSGFAYYQATTYEMKDYFATEGYSVKVFRNAQVEFPTYFKGLTTNISFDENHPEKSTINATIDATTVDTGNELMTVHAKEADILNTEKFKTITFVSSAVRQTTTAYEVTGKLTLKGITKEITFPFTFENETFSGKFSIRAKDFDINSENAVPSGEIKIELVVPVRK